MPLPASNAKAERRLLHSHRLRGGSDVDPAGKGIKPKQKEKNTCSR